MDQAVVWYISDLQRVNQARATLQVDNHERNKWNSQAFIFFAWKVEAESEVLQGHVRKTQ